MNNNPEKGGSVYLRHKITNAKNRIAKHLSIKHSVLDDVEQETKEPQEAKDKKKVKPDHK